MVKIATWNVNSINVRLAQVLSWCAETNPDILAMQETKVQDEKFPADAFEAVGYHVAYSGQKTYNGMAIISRQPVEEILTDIPTLDDPQRRILAATVGGVRVLNLYVPNGETVSSEKYVYKLNWLAKVKQYVEEQLRQFPQLIVLGDFNIAPEDKDVYDPAQWAGKVLCSQPERDALQQIRQLGLTDCFRLFEQPEKSYSWWDYRMLGFRRNRGLRIDHIFANSALTASCTACAIDKAPRKWERPSDHAPVWADFAIELQQ